MSTMTHPSQYVTLDSRLRGLSDEDLTAYLVDTARDCLTLQPLADSLAIACRVLQARHGRSSSIGTRDPRDPRTAFAEQVDKAGGFKAMAAGDIRRAMGAALITLGRDHTVLLCTDPDAPPLDLPTGHLALVRTVGLDVFPPHIPAGEVPVTVYEPTTTVGTLLSALATGQLVDDTATALMSGRTPDTPRNTPTPRDVHTAAKTPGQAPAPRKRTRTPRKP